MASLSRSVLCFSPARTASSRGGRGTATDDAEPERRPRPAQPVPPVRGGPAAGVRTTAQTRESPSARSPRRRSRRRRRRVRGRARPGPTAAGAARCGSAGRRPGRRPDRPRSRPRRGCGPDLAEHVAEHRGQASGDGAAGGGGGRAGSPVGDGGDPPVVGDAVPGIGCPAPNRMAYASRCSPQDRWSSHVRVRSKVPESGRPAQVDGSIGRAPVLAPRPVRTAPGRSSSPGSRSPAVARRPVVARQTRGGPCPRRRRPR